ncbi:MAG: HypC/HybG/HupF family hydrogenase formation chaperone, partial [Desulfurella sp.]
MCIGIPMQIVEVYEDGISGVVEAGGTKKHCFFMLIDNPKVGDYVLVHAGNA